MCKSVTTYILSLLFHPFSSLSPFLTKKKLKVYSLQIAKKGKHKFDRTLMVNNNGSPTLNFCRYIHKLYTVLLNRKKNPK